MTDPSDVDLVRRLASPDRGERERAFAVLFERHRQKAYDLAWRVLGDPGLAGDAVQEAFLTVYRKGPAFEERAQFTSWLYRIVLNHAIDLRRRERRHRAAPTGDPPRDRTEGPTSPLESAPAPGEAPDVLASREERAEIVRHSIARLSRKLAAVIWLRYPEGRSYEEIGEILGLPPGTVRSRLNRAHEALREILEDELERD